MKSTNIKWSSWLRVMGVISFAFCLHAQAFSQRINVSGTVSDQDTGDPVPGATILIQGQSQGTVTDIDGRYSLSAPSDAVLEFSYVGYQRVDESVNGRSVINVSLPVDVRALEEVVVVGYGTQKKSDVTGAIATVDDKTINEIPATDVALALQGRVAGVDFQRTSAKPGSDMQIRIRGNRSLGSPDGESNNPLIVLDGIPFSGSLNSINQGDIESINVLKDASATAIYGSRGSNGVILITTKKGTAGRSRLTYNGYFGVSTPLAQYDVFDGDEYAEYVTIAGTNPLTADEQESIAAGREVNWQDLLTEDNGIIQNHEIGFSGGTEKTQYLASASYFQETNAMPGQEFQRYSLRLNLDHQATNRIKIGMNMFSSYAERDGQGVNYFGSLLSYSPLMKPRNEDGSVNENLYAGHIDEPFNINPLLYLDEELFEDKRRTLQSFASLYGEVEIVEGLRYRLNVGLDLEFNRRGDFEAERLDAQTTNSANISNGHQWSYTLENLLLYDKTFNDVHAFSFTGLFSVQELESSTSRFGTTALTADYLQFYNFNQASTTIADGNLSDAQKYTKWGLLSYMARINYTYDSRYALTLTGRVDGSSRLAEGNKWFVYPAAAFAWNVNNEAFMSDAGIVSDLRVRLGWGRTSNQAIQPFQSLGRLSPINYSFGPDGGELGYFVSNLPNPDLTWEFTTTTNFGVDFGFLEDRINGSIEFYQQDTEEILQTRELPIVSGVSGGFQQNVGETRNRGVEITLGGVVVAPNTIDGFRWEVDANFFAYREEITQLVDTLTRDVANGWFVGEPIDAVFDYRKVGIWQLGEQDEIDAFDPGRLPGDIRVADVDGDGIRTDQDRTILGTLNPDWAAGVTNRFYFKGADLSVVLFGRVGGLIVSRLHQNQSLEGRRNHLDLDYWTPDNPTNAYPRTGDQFPQYQSTMGYFSGTYWKIRTLSLGYTIPRNVLSSISLGDARVYMTVNNPFRAFGSELVDAGGLDPEPNRRGGTRTPGFGNRLTYDADAPIMTSYIFGVNLTF
ncbi:MAG: TonB-dependent receptor [Bacteroidota bacterium]